MGFFWIDADVLIQAKNHWYAFDVMPSFWSALEEAAKNDKLRSPEMVLRELEPGKDELLDWANGIKDKLFVVADQQVQSTMGTISSYVNATYRQPHIAKFLSGADPWLIAHAKNDGGTVITHETLKLTDNKDGPIKIPNIGQHFSVQCEPLLYLLRNLGFKR